MYIILTVIITTMSAKQKGENIIERRHVKLTGKEERCCHRGCGTSGVFAIA
jgi:hypothetical protein